MENATPELDREEAAVALSILLAFADDNPSDEEVVIMRKYYHFSALESAIAKLEKAGFSYPEGLKDAKRELVKILQKEDRNFRLRTMAVAQLLAEADGVVDQREMNIINRFSHALGITLFEAAEYAKTSLKEIDEVSDYFDIPPVATEKTDMELSLEEAGIALCTLVAFSDDDPSEEEMGVIREYYPLEAAETLLKKMEARELSFPADLGRVEPAITAALAAGSREDQLQNLAIAYKVSAADGQFRKEELAILEKYCIEFGIGMQEVISFFKASIV